MRKRIEMSQEEYFNYVRYKNFKIPVLKEIYRFHLFYWRRILEYWAFLPFTHPKIRVFFHRLRGVKIGKNVIIGSYVTIDETCPELIEIQDEVDIGPKVSILAHNRYPFFPKTKAELSPVKIEKGVKIGIGAIIFPGVTIGEGSVIGAGAVVTNDIPEYTIALGIPAKPVKKVDFEK